LGVLANLAIPPLLFISPQAIIYIGLYAPLVFISLKNTKKQPSVLEYCLQWVICEIPLFIWIHVYSWLGWRALEVCSSTPHSSPVSNTYVICGYYQPFYSDIDDVVSVGSVPLSRDVPFLHSNGVVGVVNMCREYPGPVDAYRAHNIRQLHLPTPDLHEPSLEQIKDMIVFIDDVLKTGHSVGDNDGGGGGGGRIFIHCKGGRGRAVIAAVCYFISKGCSPAEAFDKIKAKRDVAARAVLGCNLVAAFAEHHNIQKCS
jgi:hypothetical protein